MLGELEDSILVPITKRWLVAKYLIKAHGVTKKYRAARAMAGFHSQLVDMSHGDRKSHFCRAPCIDTMWDSHPNTSRNHRTAIYHFVFSSLADIHKYLMANY